MDLYITSLLLGAVGLAVMALSGLGHGGHPGGHAAGHGGGHELVHMDGHVLHVHTHVHGSGAKSGRAPGTQAGGFMSRAFWSLTSPRFIFSFLLGLGAAGELLRPVTGGVLQFAGAVAGAVLFERILVTPLWNFSMRFASMPAQTLESAVSDEATAVTGFDANGNGIVSLEMDGQVVQILATLQPADRSLGVRVRAGQKVRIEDVNAEQNRCTVSVL
ncbi:MAG TPA: hypothetical protein VHB25_07745 [Gemmatimonadaceae bacterium]|nr:hypothetical protein [Gemmatimonadaceae bacterium]